MEVIQTLLLPLGHVAGEAIRLQISALSLGGTRRLTGRADYCPLGGGAVNGLAKGYGHRHLLLDCQEEDKIYRT